MRQAPVCKLCLSGLGEGCIVVHMETASGRFCGECGKPRKPRWTTRKVKGAYILSLRCGRMLVTRLVLIDNEALMWDSHLFNYAGKQWVAAVQGRRTLIAEMTPEGYTWTAKDVETTTKGSHV